MKITIIPVGYIGTNCYLLAADDGSCAVIDPGAQGEKIANIILQQKLTPKFILLTHGHHDHIEGVLPLREALVEKGVCEEKLDVYIGEKDEEQLKDGNKSYAIMFDGCAPITDAKLLKEGDSLKLAELEINVIETPGHTLGGVTYQVEDVLFTGDTLFYGDVGRTDLYGGDYDTLIRSLKKLAALPGNYKVLPGHGEGSMLDFERSHNRYINE